MRERPRAVLAVSGVTVPDGLLAQLLGVLLWYADDCRGVRRPAMVARPRMTPELQLLLAVVDQAAREHAVRASAAGSSAARSPAASGAGCVSVAEAAGMLQVSERRVRQLVGGSALVASKGPRDVWEIDRDSVLRRKRDGTGT